MEPRNLLNTRGIGFTIYKVRFLTIIGKLKFWILQICADNIFNKNNPGKQKITERKILQPRFRKPFFYVTCSVETGVNKEFTPGP